MRQAPSPTFALGDLLVNRRLVKLHVWSRRAATHTRVALLLERLLTPTKHLRYNRLIVGAVIDVGELVKEIVVALFFSSPGENLRRNTVR